MMAQFCGDQTTLDLLPGGHLYSIKKRDCGVEKEIDTNGKKRNAEDRQKPASHAFLFSHHLAFESAPCYQAQKAKGLTLARPF
jgi:hypothetical protein